MKKQSTQKYAKRKKMCGDAKIVVYCTKPKGHKGKHYNDVTGDRW